MTFLMTATALYPWDTMNPETTPELNICNDFTYPSYEFVSNELITFSAENRDYCESINIFNIDAEYGEYNHEYLKMIWDNINDDTIIKTCGENINQRGGFTALQANYYAFLHVMRLAVRNNTDKYRDSFIDTKHTISINWDDIGDWKD